jgi:hypothetical protein
LLDVPMDGLPVNKAMITADGTLFNFPATY